MGRVVLRKGREDSLRRFHPWIFSGAVASVEGDPREGEAVEVTAHDGGFLAVGHWQKGSIAVRVLSFTDEFMPDGDAGFRDSPVPWLCAAGSHFRRLPAAVSSTERATRSPG